MYSQTNQNKAFEKSGNDKKQGRLMGQERVVNISAAIDAEGRLELHSKDTRLTKRAAGWRYTPPSDEDKAVYVIGDFHTPEGAQVAVRVYSLKGEKALFEWTKTEGLCRSPTMETGTQLCFFVTATRVASTGSSSSSAGAAIAFDDFELCYGGGKIETLKHGGGDDDF